MTFIDYVATPASFVHAATICYVLGMLTRRELVLRGFLLCGTAFYILYYYYVTTTPLWEAILTSVLIGMANVPPLYRIFRERSTWGMGAQMLHLYGFFPNFNPGQFRRFMRKARIVEHGDVKALLTQGQAPDQVYLTMSDGFTLRRGALETELGPGNFLGEISFLLGGPATATVIAQPGCRYVVWDRADLRDLLNRVPTLESATTVLLSKDIARKLSVSFPQGGAHIGAVS